MKYEKKDLEKFILEDKLTYREIGKMYGVSDTYIKKISKNFGIKLEVRSKFPIGFKPHNYRSVVREKCKHCEKIIENSKGINQIFCDKNCEVDFKISEKYKHYLAHQTEYCYDRNMSFVKKHLLLEQNNKCSICTGSNKWNNKDLIFVLDHTDGDAANNLRKNLRLVCPNCDSQLDTFKSKNKNSSRKERYLKNKKN